MLCSARELKLSDDHGGLLELAADAPLGPDIREHLQLDDTLFTLKLTPNLAHCAERLRHGARGVGADRRAAAHAGHPAGGRRGRPEAAGAQGAGAGPVRALFRPHRRNVNTRPRRRSGWWTAWRAAASAAVTALVDISNYVMFEYGRPTHIFDLDKIHGGLDVRWGKAGRDAQAAQRQHRRARREGRRDRRRPGGRVAGRHHGRRRHGGVDDTRHVYVEAAFWWPEAVPGARAASTSPPTPGTASSAASIRRSRWSTSSASPS
jgi:phenylalanyl-tRNA synthetase beta chain